MDRVILLNKKASETINHRLEHGVKFDLWLAIPESSHWVYNWL